MAAAGLLKTPLEDHFRRRQRGPGPPIRKMYARMIVSCFEQKPLLNGTYSIVINIIIIY